METLIEMFVFLFSILFLNCKCFILAPYDGNNATLVDADCGQVLGEYIAKDQTYVFRGIPYAEPPVGRRRWQPPVPISKARHNCWNGTFIANAFGNMCFQQDYSNNAAYIGSEDCLFLNVWTPSLKPTQPVPVMFWIHGGSLITGNGNQQEIGGAPKLARDTNMVYVSINYRLHAFGFMALEWLRQISPYNTSGNYGFMDMIAGLQWVQQNIRNFGGDPNQVTVYGQSSGGTSIFALLASPLCKGLFHKAWLMSASPILNKTAEDAFKDNEVFVRNTKCSDVDCLYAMSSDNVTASVPWDVFPYWQMSDLSAIPTKGHFDGAVAIVDGYVLKEAPFEAWTRGHGVDVPVVIGTTAQETDFFVDPLAAVNWTWSTGDYEEHVRNALGQFSDVAAKAALMFYPPGQNTPEYQLSTLSTDLRMTCGNDYLTIVAASSFTSPVYRYVATYSPSHPMYLFGVDIPSRYAAHGIDLYAFYGTMNYILRNTSTADLVWETNVQKEILSFIRSGRPATADWKPYPMATALLSGNTTVVEAYHSKECEFWLANGFFSYSWIN